MRVSPAGRFGSADVSRCARTRRLDSSVLTDAERRLLVHAELEAGDGVGKVAHLDKQDADVVHYLNPEGGEGTFKDMASPNNNRIFRRECLLKLTNDEDALIY